jgi:hypothetical protein
MKEVTDILTDLEIAYQIAIAHSDKGIRTIGCLEDQVKFCYYIFNRDNRDKHTPKQYRKANAKNLVFFSELLTIKRNSISV